MATTITTAISKPQALAQTLAGLYSAMNGFPAQAKQIMTNFATSLLGGQIYLTDGNTLTLQDVLTGPGSLGTDAAKLYEIVIAVDAFLRAVDHLRPANTPAYVGFELPEGMTITPNEDGTVTIRVNGEIV